MDDKYGGYTCLDCIWHDQCEDENPCAFFDDGRYSYELYDLEVEIEVEVEKTDYKIDYLEYINEYGDGNCE